MSQLIKLGGIEIKKPSDFQIDDYDISDSGRVISGDMVMDLIAKKKKFMFKYTVINGVQMDAIMAIINTNTMFFAIQYVENDSTKTATVYCGHKERKQFRTDEGAWYWKDFNFDLIEQ